MTADMSVVTGVNRTGGTFGVSSMTVARQDLSGIATDNAAGTAAAATSLGDVATLMTGGLTDADMQTLLSVTESTWQLLLMRQQPVLRKTLKHSKISLQINRPT